MHFNITHLVGSYGYIGVFVMLALEYLILVVPGETTLTTVGILSHNHAYHFSDVWMVVSATLGTFTGSMIAYGIGRLFGRPLLVRYGKYVFLNEQRINQSEHLFQSYPILMLFVSKYIAVVRDVVPYIAGVNKLKLRLFVPLMFIASVFWTTTFIVAGGLIGQLWTVVQAHWRVAIGPAIAVVVLGVIAYIYIHRKMAHLGTGDEASNQDDDSLAHKE